MGKSEPEVWKEIPGWPLYEVSDLGRVRSWNGWGGQRRYKRKEPFMMRPSVTGARYKTGGGYKKVKLVRYPDGQRENSWFSVHRLVLTAFVGPCPPGHVGLHNDGRSGNNRLSNLRWGTLKDNVRDALRHGTAVTGKTSPKAKLTEEQVIEIRERHAAGDISQSALGREYGVCQSTIARIIYHKAWRWVGLFPSRPPAPSPLPERDNGGRRTASKIREVDVQEMRELFASQVFNQVELAELYDLTSGQVSKIILGQSWNDVGGPTSRTIVRLSRADAAEIRRLYDTGLYTQEELGSMFNTCPSNVGCIIRGETHKEAT